MVTEDIDISWKLQMHHWQIQYEPCALVWILMPETIWGLYKQRLRWAQGGSEVLLRYTKKLFAWRQRRMWPVAIEYIMSLVWSYTMAIIVTLWVLGHVIDLPHFGRIFLGELKVVRTPGDKGKGIYDKYRFHLTMIRLQMGCLATGGVGVGTTDSNGTGGKGSGGGN